MTPFIHPFRDTQANNLERSAFARGPAERRIRVWVDTDALPGEALAQALVDFRFHEQIELVTLTPNNIDIQSDGYALLSWNGIDGSSHRSGFMHAENNLTALRNQGYDLSGEPDMERRCVMAMLAARGVDSFVTTARVGAIVSHAYPHCNAMTHTAALATIGLFLRLREDFVYKQSQGGQMSTTSSSFYDVMAHDLLPDTPRWVAFCTPPESPFHASTQGLASAIPQRVARALRARDRLLGQLFREPSSSTIDEALFYFDGFLVSWAAAFDAAAKVVNRCYQLGKKGGSWRHDKWVDALKEKAPAFACLVAPQSRQSDLLQLLYVLRNLVHEEPLSVVGVISDGGTLVEYRAGVSKASRDDLVSCIERLGPPVTSAFGRIAEDGFALNLHRYTELLLPEFALALDQIMRTTEVEQFGINAPMLESPLSDEVGQYIELFRGLSGIGRAG